MSGVRFMLMWKCRSPWATVKVSTMATAGGFYSTEGIRESLLRSLLVALASLSDSSAPARLFFSRLPYWQICPVKGQLLKSAWVSNGTDAWWLNKHTVAKNQAEVTSYRWTMMNSVKGADRRFRPVYSAVTARMHAVIMELMEWRLKQWNSG